jgi:ketosteroid isomerase-like protein
MNRIVLFVVALLFSTHLTAQLEEAAIADVLDRYHRAAASADWDTYFNVLSEDAVFIGTDVSERWPKAVFREYAGGRSSGWTYTPRERHINLTPDGNSAWFDEVLDSQNYGTSRGTGVLIKTGAGWKISQYHLTFPIPNALSDRFTNEIKAWEASQ